MQKHVLILGGYGGVGRALANNILKHTNASITIAGRDEVKAMKFAEKLTIKYPERCIMHAFADASNMKSLLIAFMKIDIVIVTASTPEFIENIAQAAIITDTDMVDILVRGDVVDKLDSLRERIILNKRIFITQAGFHPGLPAPFIKYAKNKFDQYQSANIVMVMNSIFEKPESTHEILHEVGEGNARVLQNGLWKKATYKNALKINFSENFGTRTCFPLQMREIYPLANELGLREMGVYSAGFNSYVDNFVFPLTMLLQYFKKGFGIKYCGKLMHRAIIKHFTGKHGVEFRLMAKGIKNGVESNYTLEAHSPNAFEFTAQAVVACLKQYLENHIDKPGLYLMGNVVNEKVLIEDLKGMGLTINEKQY